MDWRNDFGDPTSAAFLVGVKVGATFAWDVNDEEIFTAQRSASVRANTAVVCGNLCFFVMSSSPRLNVIPPMSGRILLRDAG